MKPPTRRERERIKRAVRFGLLRDRIVRNSTVDEASGCRIWKGKRNKAYGVIQVRVPGYKTPRNLFVHRVAWEAWHERRMPRGRHGAHWYKCISPLCCEWTHIRATTQSSNERDKRRAKTWQKKMFREIFPPTHTVSSRRRSAKLPQ